MASRTSSTGVVNRGTSGGNSFYETDVTTIDEGGVRTETYRTDGAGENRVLIRTIEVNNLSEVTKNEFTSDVTIDEQRDFLNKRSTLNKLILDQVNSVSSDLKSEITNNNGNADQILNLSAALSVLRNGFKINQTRVKSHSYSVTLDIQMFSRNSKQSKMQRD